MSGMWGEAARRHWQRHLPKRYAALEDPDAFFADLDEQATEYYVAWRDAVLDGLNPNDGTIRWPDFLDLLAWANQAACEAVEVELIFVPGEDQKAGG